MSDLRPVYQALESPRHLVEVVSVLLLIGLIFDGYAILLAALALNRWFHKKLRNENRLLQASSLLAGDASIRAATATSAQAKDGPDYIQRELDKRFGTSALK